MSAASISSGLFASVGDQDALATELDQKLRQVWIDRDRSWLQFNDRVLAEALDNRNPLLERAKFLAIVTTNADEFFMKRLSVLRESAKSPRVAAHLEELKKLIERTEEAQARCWNEQLLPALAEGGVPIRHWSQLTDAQRQEAGTRFDTEISPALTPLIMTSGELFPFVSNLSISLVFPVRDPATEEQFFARVKIPNELKHWIALNSDCESGRSVYVRLHEVICANLHKLYPAMEIGATGLVRITRDAEVEAKDGNTVVDEIRRQIRQRRFEPVVRLQFTPTVDARIRTLLTSHFHLTPTDIYEALDHFDCPSLFELSGLPMPALRDKPYTPVTPPALDGVSDIFAAIRAGDILVHHPYESFDASVERFVAQAAIDPKVVAIKMTVYRVGDDTPFVRSLVKAAEAGKQVACVIELHARFDEERNIHWADELAKAGAHIAFGVKGLKIHGKTALVVRKEADGLRSYVHIGTGNYHSRTARLYADVGLFTCDPSIALDVVSLFHYLTGHSQAPSFHRLLVAPAAMRDRFLELIAREVEHKHAGRPARIVAKLNQLEDPEIISALCDASSAGVPVDLIIRGFCCLLPGVHGQSENIRVRSIIGRFLEHSRIYYFANGSEAMPDGDFFIGSADWMHRNLSKRVEVAAPVLAPAAKQRLAEILELCLTDRRQAWLLGPDGDYHRAAENTDEAGIHQTLMDLALRHAQ